jgi:hypothetical protein
VTVITTTVIFIKNRLLFKQLMFLTALFALTNQNDVLIIMQQTKPRGEKVCLHSLAVENLAGGVNK